MLKVTVSRKVSKRTRQIQQQLTTYDVFSPHQPFCHSKQQNQPTHAWSLLTQIQMLDLDDALPPTESSHPTRPSLETTSGRQLLRPWTDSSDSNATLANRNYGNITALTWVDSTKFENFGQILWHLLLQCTESVENPRFELSRMAYCV